MADAQGDEPAVTKNNNLSGILSTIAVVLIFVALMYFGSRMG